MQVQTHLGFGQLCGVSVIIIVGVGVVRGGGVGGGNEKGGAA